MQATKIDAAKALLNDLLAKPADYWTDNGDITEDGNTSSRQMHTGDLDNATTI